MSYIILDSFCAKVCIIPWQSSFIFRNSKVSKSIKDGTYNKRPKMRRDAWMKVFFFLGKKTIFIWASLFIFGCPSYVAALATNYNFLSIFLTAQQLCWSEKKCQRQGSRTTDTWWIDHKFSIAQNHISIPNRNSCKMYESLSFLKKKWLRNAKSRTRDTQWQNLSR